MADRRPERRTALREALVAAHLDAVLLTSLPNIRYITGFSGSSALVLVTARETLFITDFRYATPDSSWSIMEGRWGLVPDMGGVELLAELIAIDRAKRLVMTAETFTGAEAQGYGLVPELSDDPVAAATAFAERLALQSPDQLAGAKRLLNDSWFRPARCVLARERFWQLPLLFAPNTRIALGVE